MKTAICLGGNGFIGHHMARKLNHSGYVVTVADIKEYEYGDVDFGSIQRIGDLRDINFVESLGLSRFDEVYCFACQMGGAGYVFTGENDSDIMSDSALININILKTLAKGNFKGKVFYSSSACIYPMEMQDSTDNLGLKETDAYPAHPDSCYGWEKLFSEQLFEAFARNNGIDIRIARFHNIYGPEGTYKGGREKAPAAMIRKAIESEKEIEVWGSGTQTRSFLYIDECIEGIIRLMNSDYKKPINIGSDEMVSINQLAQMAIDISGKDLKIKNVYSTALGVKGRNSDNTLIEQKLNWKPNYSLRKGMEKTFEWIAKQYNL
jgi:GDP-D-mannose 3',5'-epimerase